MVRTEDSLVKFKPALGSMTGYLTDGGDFSTVHNVAENGLTTQCGRTWKEQIR
jgi:hypothetical protein